MPTQLEQLVQEARTQGKYPYSNIPDLVAHPQFEAVAADTLHHAVRRALGSRMNNEIMLTPDHVKNALNDLAHGHLTTKPPLPELNITTVRPRVAQAPKTVHRPQASEHLRKPLVQLKSEEADFIHRISTEQKIYGGLGLMAAAMSGAGAYSSLRGAFSGNRPDGKVDASLVGRGMLELAFAAGMAYIGVQSFRGR